MESAQKKSRKTYKLSRIKIALLGAAIFIVALGLGLGIQRYYGQKYTGQVIQSIKPVRENNTNYSYISPLLSFDFSQANAFLENAELESKINAYVKAQYQNQNAQSISVYVKNFTDNKWAGVNQDTQYHPGSLLKVLIMMAYFREAQLDPSVLNRTFTYSSSTDAEVNAVQFHLPTVLVVGKIYTFQQLVKSMIANSDNGAETLLIDNVNRNILNNAYIDLSIPNPDTTSGDYTISARQYSAFLRILYNSTYLTEAYSEQALGIMAESSYKDGISAGLPPNVVVAQKYGERIDSDNSGKILAIELHNCGIVYAAKHPYSICIMTKGPDVQKLTAAIKGISALVYSDLNSQN